MQSQGFFLEGRQEGESREEGRRGGSDTVTDFDDEGSREPRNAGAFRS